MAGVVGILAGCFIGFVGFFAICGFVAVVGDYLPVVPPAWFGMMLLIFVCGGLGGCIIDGALGEKK